jgi:hypothetical protein
VGNIRLAEWELSPQVATGGPAKVAVSMDGATFGPQSNVNFEYFALVSFAVGRRPYTIEATGKLVIVAMSD